MVKRFTLFGLLLILVSCFPIETNDAEKTYEYWAGGEPPKEIELIKGQYYQSPHFSLEYELFLKFKSDNKWFEDFVENNKLEIDTIGNDWTRRTDLPEWFIINRDYVIYALDQEDEFERSRYLRNPKTGICYIYETVGM